jgi:hypothetical protein
VAGDHPGGHDDEAAEGSEKEGLCSCGKAAATHLKESETFDEDDSVGEVGGFGGGEDAGDCAKEKGLEGWVLGEEFAVGREVDESEEKGAWQEDEG